MHIDLSQESIMRGLQRRAVYRALNKYVAIRLRSERGALSERSLVWMIDADRAISMLKPNERTVMLARIHGFTIPEIAMEMHMTQQRAERYIARAHRKMAEAFIAHDCIRDLRKSSDDPDAIDFGFPICPPEIPANYSSSF
jgi:FixJ family two-component response regulator